MPNQQGNCMQAHSKECYWPPSRSYLKCSFTFAALACTSTVRRWKAKPTSDFELAPFTRSSAPNVHVTFRQQSTQVACPNPSSKSSMPIGNIQMKMMRWCHLCHWFKQRRWDMTHGDTHLALPKCFILIQLQVAIIFHAWHQTIRMTNKWTPRHFIDSRPIHLSNRQGPLNGILQA